MKRTLIVMAMLVAFASVAQATNGSPFLSISDGSFASNSHLATATVWMHSNNSEGGSWRPNIILSSQRLASNQAVDAGYGWLVGQGNHWYCADLNSTQAGTDWGFYDTHQMTQPTGTPTGNYGTMAGLRRAAWLIDTYHDDAMGTPITRAALQIAVWEAVYDGGDPSTTELILNEGDFQAHSISASSDDIIAQASTWYAASAGRSGRGVYAVDGQNLLSRTEIPEPSTLILLGLGLTAAGVGVIRRRRKA